MKFQEQAFRINTKKVNPAEESFEEIGKMMAHEMRNLLTVWRVVVDLYECDIDTMHQTILSHEINSVEGFINRMMLISKSYRASDWKKEGINQLVRECIDALAFQAYKHNVSIKVCWLEEEYEPVVVKEQLSAGITELLKNAIQASGENSEVNITIKKEADRLQISIRDQGTGMDSDQVERLGRPTYMIEGYGTGLGVAVAKRGVFLHNGTLSYLSKEQEGTEVRLELPLSKTSFPEIMIPDDQAF
ncbi:hypothetical protein CR205_00295 [Alteribacter lacisalsi]|uniref:histidine kinase n=1 Tax=Alteribacter lacisalsi TaxID=2045244 RepID=A0A2W0H5G7_9BACI|nr:HAMP domain-containing sensor histidine kinase [Alteribacter lacisalsi]PYZ97083.1 hypothetical protein CR205_00295 [Alteribacter lacisalsi]